MRRFIPAAAMFAVTLLVGAATLTFAELRWTGLAGLSAIFGGFTLAATLLLVAKSIPNTEG